MFVCAPRYWVPGLAILGAGEVVRLAAVGHIGLPSRTRADDVGALVRSGPYGWVRNPLYLGNLLLYAGLGVVLWPSALVAVPILAVYYELIVRWEERNLAARIGEPYRRYLAEVPRWVPRAPSRRADGAWRLATAVRSERSTLVAIGVVLVLLWLRARAG
ncbi:MAG: isoprenylcysteine carboxylmethyltransferase family protein [Pseudomonadota bacterium]|nr:isoprenylcysteine carboxylmethyltransferase family protein [Pseudomonadota bacterium]